MCPIYQCIYEWCTLVYLGSLNDYLLFLRSFTLTALPSL